MIQYSNALLFYCSLWLQNVAYCLPHCTVLAAQLTVDMAAAAVDMEFTPLESFHLLFKNLWSVNIAYRIKLNVIDTILFRDGEPYYWIFTSEQTGVCSSAVALSCTCADLPTLIQLGSKLYTGNNEEES